MYQLSHCSLANLLRVALYPWTWCLDSFVFSFKCLKKTSPLWKTVSFTSVQLGNDWSSPQANYHVKSTDQYVSGSSTLLALFPRGRVLKNLRGPWQMCQEPSRGLSILEWGTLTVWSSAQTAAPLAIWKWMQVELTASGKLLQFM